MDVMEFLKYLIFIVGYFLVLKYVLPKIGVHT